MIRKRNLKQPKYIITEDLEQETLCVKDHLLWGTREPKGKHSPKFTKKDAKDFQNS